MKLKKVLIAVAFLALFSCTKNPQKNAQHKADQHENAAVRDANSAEKHAVKAVDREISSVKNEIMSNANEAMAQVQVPKFKNIVANEQVKKIGNDVVGYVNANDNRKADHYQKLIGRHIESVKKAVKNKLISADDASKINDYAQKLAGTVGLKIDIN